jgi:hypothetical protein
MVYWMFNCKEVAYRVSESLDRKLPIHHWLGMRVHLGMCKFCSQFLKQLLIIRRASRLHGIQSEREASPATLSLEARSRIKEALRRI